MTAADALDAFEGTFPWTVLLHRIEHVLAAGGLKATVSAHEMPEGGTVEGNHEINQPNGDGIDDPHACIIPKMIRRSERHRIALVVTRGGDVRLDVF